MGETSNIKWALGPAIGSFNCQICILPLFLVLFSLKIFNLHRYITNISVQKILVNFTDALFFLLLVLFAFILS